MTPAAKVKAAKSASAIVNCDQFSCGPSWGEYGCASYLIVGKDRNPSISGLHIADILPEAFATGAVVRVTVELLKRGKLKRNEWWVSEERKKRLRAKRKKRPASPRGGKGKR